MAGCNPALNHADIRTFKGIAMRRTMRSILRSAAAIAIAGSSGCATHVKFLCHKTSATTTVVDVRTDPPGASLTLSDGRSLRTPAQLVLQSGEDVRLMIAEDGYEPVEVELRSRLNLWFYLGNLLMLPPIGYLVDIEQGATQNLSPGTVNVVLKPVGPRQAPRPEPLAASEEGVPDAAILERG